jgi:hypothetical protein
MNRIKEEIKENFKSREYERAGFIKKDCKRVIILIKYRKQRFIK